MERNLLRPKPKNLLEGKRVVPKDDTPELIEEIGEVVTAKIAELYALGEVRTEKERKRAASELSETIKELIGGLAESMKREPVSYTATVTEWSKIDGQHRVKTVKFEAIT